MQDAAEAREEARRVRAELAVSEAERSELARRARQLVRKVVGIRASEWFPLHQIQNLPAVC